MDQPILNINTNNITASRMKFLFFVGNGTTMKSPLCWMSLKLSVTLFCLIYLAQSYFFLPLISLRNIYFISYLIFLWHCVGLTLIMISTFNKNFKYAQAGLNLFQFSFLIQIIWGLIAGFLNFFFSQYEMALYFVNYAFHVIISFYLTFLIFSFTKELGLGNDDIIEGRHPDNNFSVRYDDNYNQKVVPKVEVRDHFKTHYVNVPEPTNNKVDVHIHLDQDSDTDSYNQKISN